MGRFCISLSLVLLGCSAADPCDSFPGETCLTLEVRGSIGINRIDQVHLDAAEMGLVDSLSPKAPQEHELPVQLALLPEAGFVGEYQLSVRGFLRGAIVGKDVVHGVVDRSGKHDRIFATLIAADIDRDAGTGEDAPSPPDLAGLDLSGLSGIDLAGADLAMAQKGTWTPTMLSGNSEITRIFVTAADDVWAVGSGPGAIFHSQGDDVWTPRNFPGDPTTIRFIDVWASGPADIYALDDARTVYHSTGGDFTSVSVTSDANTSPARIFGFGPDDVYICASTTIDTPADPTGGDTILHLSGGTWKREFANAQLGCGAVFGATASDVYAGVIDTSSGGIAYGDQLRRQNSTWTRQFFGSIGLLRSIWGSGPTDLYSVDSRHGILRSSGDGKWFYTRQTNSEDFAQITGSGPSDVWVIGTGMPDGGGTIQDILILRSSGDGHFNPDPALTPQLLQNTRLNTIASVRFGELYVGGIGQQKTYFLHRH